MTQWNDAHRVILQALRNAANVQIVSGPVDDEQGQFNMLMRDVLYMLQEAMDRGWEVNHEEA